MRIDHTNLRETLQNLDKTRVIELYCNRNIASVCSLFIFTQILKADLFKYQIEFEQMDQTINFLFKTENKEYTLTNEQNNCTCFRKEIVGITSLYKVIKSMDFMKSETIWPFAVCFSHYKIFMNEKRYLKNNENGITNNCDSCNALEEEIFYSIRLLNCKFDGIFIQKRNRLDFLSGSTLFQALKNDLKFLHDKKLFYNKDSNNERKIGEYLARYGISINNANDPYNALDCQTKKQCNTTFGEEDKLIYRSGHDVEISAIEHSFLILFYLYKEKDMYAYMCLEKRKLVDVSKASRFYEKIINIFKEAVIGATKTGDLAIFKIKYLGLTVAQITTISYVLHRFIRIYLGYRNENNYQICISFMFDNQNQILYSEDFTFEILKNFKKDLGENFVKIEKTTFSSVIKDLANHNK